MENTESQKNPEEKVSSASSQDSQSEETDVSTSDEEVSTDSETEVSPEECGDENTETKEESGKTRGGLSPNKDRDL